ncbi:MAG: GNAT family N-acetyltransferase [Bdellovibrionaceae bacterium]|nr:GNAT family N-acetyltransferase [Pseudobdellovibrionaceae bacterium]
MNFVFKVEKENSNLVESLSWLDTLSSPAFFWSAEKIQETWLRIQACELSWLESAKGQVCAFILWQKLGEELEILALATHPDRRKQGLMSQLLSLWLSALKREGIRIVYLEVHAANAEARALYERIGFSSYAQRKAYYRDGGDAYLYRLEF